MTALYDPAEARAGRYLLMTGQTINDKMLLRYGFPDRDGAPEPCVPPRPRA